MLPDGVSDEEFIIILKNAEILNKTVDGGAIDLVSVLNRIGVKAESQTFNFPETKAIQNFIFVILAIL